MKSFDEFKKDQIKKNPSLKRSSDTFLRKMYEEKFNNEEVEHRKEEEQKAINSIIVTTETITPYPVKKRIDIISAECAFGMNIFRDIFAGIRDVVGGRSDATQKILRDARTTALDELKKEALRIGANGVIGVSLDYNEFSGGGKSMLFLVVTGTAVVFDLTGEGDQEVD